MNRRTLLGIVLVAPFASIYARHILQGMLADPDESMRIIGAIAMGIAAFAGMWLLVVESIERSQKHDEANPTFGRVIEEDEVHP